VALEQLEAQRIEYIRGQLERGSAVPVPRPPLAHRISEFEALLATQPSLNQPSLNRT
jgi:hypothetical protein